MQDGHNLYGNGSPQKPNESPSSRSCCGGHLCANLLIVLGVVLIVVGIGIGAGLPTSVNSALEKQVVMCSAEEGSKPVFTDPYGECDDCSPYFISIYMLNTTNAEEYLAGTSTTLKVQEMGPYVYRRREFKLDVTFDDNYRVSYKTYTNHSFDPSLSCSDCSDEDEVTAIDVSYMSVISSTGGEFNLLAAVTLGSFGASYTTPQLVDTLTHDGTKMMRWMNGLNSLNAEAMKNVAANNAVLHFLAAGPAVIANMDLTGFAYNGLFVTRTVSQWAIGYPSLLLGLMLGSRYVNHCVGQLNDLCASCTGDSCASIAIACAQCTAGAGVVASNSYTCGVVKSVYAAKYGEAEAAAFVATTCGLCETYGICAMALPGIAELSGMDYSTMVPDTSTLKTYTKRTGCDDLSHIGEYERYDGVTVNAVWAELDERRNPTLSELMAFSSYADCSAPPDNLTCFTVSGTDGSSLKPGGVSISGFAKDPTVSSFQTFAGPLKQSIAIESSGEEVEFSGVKLQRFGRPEDAFSYSSDKARLGTGYPVDGVHSLAFVTGFLSYVSNPFFLHGDASLYESVEMTNTNGTVLTPSELYESDGTTLKAAYKEAYISFMDFEPGSGKAMRATMRSMVSYALGASVTNPFASMSDVLWPSLPVDVVLPVLWVQVDGQANEDVLKTLKGVVSLTKAFLPVTVVLIIVGVLLICGGFSARRRTNRKVRNLVSSLK